MRSCNEGPGHSNVLAQSLKPFKHNLEIEAMGHQSDNCCFLLKSRSPLTQIKEIPKLLGF